MDKEEKDKKNNIKIGLFAFIFLFLMFLGFVFSPLPSLAQDSGCGKIYLGKILSININGSTFRREDLLQIDVTVKNSQRGEHEQIVVLNILNSNDSTVYDSHAEDEDLSISMGYKERRTVTFNYEIPSNLRRGRYTISISYREFPWEPLISSKGASECPPVKTITIK